jgi:hypothetical protein
MRHFLTNNDGAAAVEMAIASPILLACLVFGANIAFNTITEQKVTAAAYAGANYFQDQVTANGLDDMRPIDDDDNKSNGSMVKTAKLVIQDAYGQSLDLGAINVSAYCGCPNKDASQSHGFDEAKSFYTFYDMSSDKDEDICPTSCSDSSTARIVAEIDITHTTKDLFGKSKTVSEHLVTRLR